MYDDLIKPYQSSDLPALQLGGILMNEHLLPNSPVNLVLKSLNRHGLIAGATGSGKTKTMQVLAEQLSLQGIPSLVMDIKGDVSGLAIPGEANEALIARCQSLNLTFSPRAYPVEMLSLSNLIGGVPLRATVTEFGPLLFSRMLDVNETQAGVITVLFEYAKTKDLPLIDLADFKALLQYVQTESGKAEVEAQFGGIATASVGTIVRKIIELEAEGGQQFFGEPAFNVMDLVRVNSEGLGIISILRLMDMQDKPKLFSTFMLKLLTDVYRLLPELGDPPKPKLVLFIDEAHLIFNNASKALLKLLDTIVKLIRSKGVGLIFCTQTPDDVPESVLGQLGLKIQHALRAFTAKDRKALKLVAQNFPPSEHYQTEQLLTNLGIGEALVSALDGKGQPTPLVQCLIRPPESRMGVLNADEIHRAIAMSTLLPKYEHRIERSSAKEILAAEVAMTSHGQRNAKESKADVQEPSVVDQISKNTLFRQIIRQIIRDITRSILSALGISKKR
ncbi:putative ATPase [Legionella lansingensis]|uniref:ATPase n=1 Tax=Legionella lansingensis TaxID=45067 RepID=A0A0W0VGB1_9GAMM|nr:helicase HerA-like domain-containing protein [Legionella lansingensis]KTD19138.1 ATPase [Legionella lansingensis]SNV45544.1 putative ATPase [Legionella lansingensis]